MYHGIDQHQSTQFNARFFSYETFDRQIRYFNRRFKIVSLNDCSQPQQDADQRLRVAITFDDGYQNNLRYAIPVLEKHNVPATFFVTAMNLVGQDILWTDLYDIGRQRCSGPIEFSGRLFTKQTPASHFRDEQGVGLKAAYRSDPRGGAVKLEELKSQMFRQGADFRNELALNDYWRLMSDEEIRTISQSPIATIGSHAVFHNNLGVIDTQDARSELSVSKSYLESIIDQPVDSLGYPDGSYAPAVIDVAEQLGYRIQCAVNYKQAADEHDPRVIDRLGLYPRSKPPQLSPRRVANRILVS